MIVVDLPPEEDVELCLPALKAGLNFIRLATPTTDDKRLPAGVVMFCGTLPAIGGIRSSPRFDMEIEDPVLGRKLEHSYVIRPLPVVS